MSARLPRFCGLPPAVVLGSSDTVPLQFPSRKVSLSDTRLRQPPPVSSSFDDLRIDNHDDLAHRLGLPQLLRTTRYCPCLDTVGLSVVDHLMGGFAFACWDPARQPYFLPRDHVGERPLYFTRSAVRVAVLPLRRRLSGCVRCPRYIAVSTRRRWRAFLAAMSPVGTETFFEA